MKYVSVYPKGDRPVWYAAYPDPKSGKRICKATDFRRDDPQGKRKAMNWAREKAAVAALNRDQNASARWELWVEPWLRLKYRKQNVTLRGYLNWWSWLYLYLSDKHIATPRALDRNAAMNYMTWRMEYEKRSGKKVVYNTARGELKFLGSIMREAILRGFAETNPCERLGLERDKAAEKPEITDAEVTLIRQKLVELEGNLPLTERWMTICFEIALHQGCRQQETSMPLERINFAAKTIRFHVKGDRIFTVPIHPGLMPLLLKLKAAGARVTCSLPAAVGRQWSRFFKGRDGRHPFMPHICFHCTRVTVVTRMARAGVPLQQAMAYVFHASALIHQVYQRLKAVDVTGCHAALVFPKRGA